MSRWENEYGPSNDLDVLRAEFEEHLRVKPPECADCGCDMYEHSTDDGCSKCACRAFRDPR